LTKATSPRFGMPAVLHIKKTSFQRVNGAPAL